LVSFDEILVFRKNAVEHMEHLRQLMIVLQQEKLYINLKKPPGDPFFVLEILHFS